jgi:hypothetical protein
MLVFKNVEMWQLETKNTHTHTHTHTFLDIWKFLLARLPNLAILHLSERS